MLLLITAVFARICWKYTGMPYQAILMETGALYQTMYLVANSLGLAPCAIGAFPERATAEILGADSRDESQVGMFALGVPKQNEVPEARITAVRLLEQSLFSHGPGGEALELTFETPAGRSCRSIVCISNPSAQVGWPAKRAQDGHWPPSMNQRCGTCLAYSSASIPLKSGGSTQGGV